MLICGMRKSKEQLFWRRFQQRYTEFPSLGLALDLSRMNCGKTFFAKMTPKMESAFAAMAELEKGAIANPDEGRMVGHYWLRNSSIAPTTTIREEIDSTVARIKSFASEVHVGTLQGAHGIFKNLLIIGIGGSALGPQFVAHALGHPASDKLRVFFFDNTDPDGMAITLATLGKELGQTLCVVISKSGGTKETRNGMLEAQAAYEAAGLKFGLHAVAITGQASDLDKHATDQGWLERFPMWDWVGGRTSETSSVGLLPAALQGCDIDSLLAGAKACDEVTRQPNIKENPAAQIALMWFYIGKGRGGKDMVVLPYKDRLELFSRYLQQLIMESLGKEKDLHGQIVNQGLTVYGNKGSTDQHAYVQQLRDGISNFFVTFIEVLQDGFEKALMVEPDVTSGDYLDGFFLGTRQALYENGRESITLTLKEVSPFSIGVLISLFERAVGYYANLINVNAYNQPGVEAGKKAAQGIIDCQRSVLNYLREQKQPCSVGQIAAGTGNIERTESVFKICEHLAANKRLRKQTAASPFKATYQVE